VCFGDRRVNPVNYRVTRNGPDVEHVRAVGHLA
jgi:hypothetical protein